MTIAEQGKKTENLSLFIDMCLHWLKQVHISSFNVQIKKKISFTTIYLIGSKSQNNKVGKYLIGLKVRSDDVLYPCTGTWSALQSIKLVS